MTEPAAEVARPRVAAGAWYALAVLTLVLVLNNLDRSIISILIEPIRKDFGFSDSQIGVLAGLAFALVYSASAIPAGILVDRVNRRNLLALAVSLWSACTALCGLAQGFWSLFLARMAVGGTESACSPAAMSMISDYFPAERRSLTIGVYCMGTALGAAVALVVGGYIAQAFGWRWAMVAAGAPGLAVGALLFLTVREPKRGAMEPRPRASDKAPTLAQSWRMASGNPVFVFTFLGISTNAVVGSGLTVWAATYLVRAHDLTLFQAGLVTGAGALFFGSAGTILGGVFGDWLIRRRGLAGAALAPAVGGVVSFVAGAVLLGAGSLFVAAAALMVWELFYRSFFGPSYNVMLSSVEPRMRGLAGSASQCATNLIGWGLGPVVVGAVSDAVGGVDGLRWGMAAVLSVSLLSAALFFLSVWWGRHAGREALPAT